MTGNYPLMSQSEEERAPFNEDVRMPKKVKVTVSITLSKTVDIEVSDYTTEDEVDEDGNHTTIYNFPEYVLKQAVEDQITLPNEAFDKLHPIVYLEGNPQDRHSLEDLKDWCVDDFEVVEE